MTRPLRQSEPRQDDSSQTLWFENRAFSSSSHQHQKYGYPTEAEALANGRRWALNNSLIANNTIVGVRRNGILARYNGQPNSGNPNDREFAIPYDNVIVNNTVVSDNLGSTSFLGAYRFGVSDTGDTDPNTGTFYPGYQFGNFTEAKTSDPNDLQNLKRGNNVVANNQAYLTDGVGQVTAGISSAGFLTGNPLFDSSGFVPTSASMLIDAGQYAEHRSEVDDSVVWSTSSTIDYVGNPRTMGADPDIGAIEFAVVGNVAPTAGDDAYNVLVNTVLSVSTPGVLSNDSDLNGDSLTAVLVANANNGNVVLYSNGSFTYTPNAGFTGADSFTYEANDGALNSSTATVNIIVNATGSAFQQDSGVQGIVSIEAENFDANMARGGNSWSSVTTPTGFSGAAALFAGPNNGDNINTGYATTSPQLDYQVNFVKTGIYYVWVRGNRQGSGSDDSLNIGLNGQEIATSDRVDFLNTTSWAWTNQTMDSAVATFNVTATGIQTLNVWMREDGLTIDKIVLTTDPSFVPTGFGPVESERNASADFDSDGDTDGADFLAWQRGFGTPNANLADGDADGDQDVDAVDLTVWQSTFDQNAAQNASSAGAALQFASTAVPEESEEIEFAVPREPAANQGASFFLASIAAGSGRFSDQNPWDAFGLSERGELNKQGFLAESDADEGDLLSVFTHEMGQHDNGSEDLLSEPLSAHARRLPSRALMADFALEMMLEDADDRFWWKEP